MSIIDKLFDKELKNLSEEEQKKKIKIQRNSLFILSVFLLIALIGFTSGFIYAHNYQLDQYFTTQYENIYYPLGKERIESVVNETQNITDPIEKLTAIADREINGFVNFLQYNRWNESYGGTKPLGSHYIYDEGGRVRAEGGKYANNPYWIAYHKIGACGELGTLFTETARQAEFEARKVVTKYVDDRNNHAWVEVKVNGEWMYFDPTIYWDNHNNKDGKILDYKWYGTLDEQTIWGAYVTGVYTENGEDITVNYPNVKQLKGLDLIIHKIQRPFILT